MKRILVCEDEDVIRDFVVINRRRGGYEVVDVPNGEEALRVFDESGGNFDVALLDVMRPPGIDGFTVCKEIRRRSSSIGIIMLSAKSQEMDKVSGLMLGADDYVIKPFRNRELISRIKNVLRRRGHVSKILYCGSVKMDTETTKVYVNGQELPVPLTRLEYKILHIMMNHPSKLFTREEILSLIWDASGSFVNDNTLTVYIKRLREKIETDPQNPQIIRTVRGMGYKLGD